MAAGRALDLAFRLVSVTKKWITGFHGGEDGGNWSLRKPLSYRNPQDVGMKKNESNVPRTRER
jgi:hypothetical protein